LPGPETKLPLQFHVEIADSGDSCAQSEHLIAYYTGPGALEVQVHPASVWSTGKAPAQRVTTKLTVQTSDLRGLAISADEKWVMLVGRGQVELRRTDVLETASLHDADFTYAAQMALAPDVLRLAIVDQDGYLTVLGLDKPPTQPVWEFERTVRALAHDEQYDHLETLGDLLQGDSEPFPGTYEPRFDLFLRHVLRPDQGPHAEPQVQPKPKQIANWLKARPDSRIARLLDVDRLIEEAWEARGSGFANTVSEEGWRVFGSKIKEAHAQIEPLLKLDHPPPGTFGCLFNIAKAEGWSEQECMEQAERLMKANPAHVPSHQILMQKFLVRWGGGAHSSADYAAWVADQVGGRAGDVLYVMLVEEIIGAEDRELVRETLGIDFDRYAKGCAELQKSAHWRPFGLLAEWLMTVALEDSERSTLIAKTIEREKTPFVPNIAAPKKYFERVFRIYVDWPE
jgi:hypothetical protein